MTYGSVGAASADRGEMSKPANIILITIGNIPFNCEE